MSEKKPNSICPICGKEFYVKPSQKKKCKNNYCSRACHTEAKKEYMSGEKNHQYGLRGEKNASWKGGIRRSSYGYNLVYAPDHPFANGDGCVFEHRLVAETFLLNDENSIVINGRRYLKKEYDVHHVNEIRTDNRVENLRVMKKEEHISMHDKERVKKCIRNRSGKFLTYGKCGVDCIKVLVTDGVKIPTKGTKDSAGFDLYCAENEPKTLQPNELYLFETGVAVQLPKNTFGALHARSGLSTKRGLMLINGVGVIDRDYTATIKVPLINLSKEPQTINPNDRIAQLVVLPYINEELELVDELEETERGKGGFGSTGR